MISFPDGKRYRTVASHYRELYGGRLQKLVLDGGFTCPNRDGTLGTGGCTFCDNAAFHPGYSTASMPISRQLEEGIVFSRVRYPRASHYLAYFQSYSGTYAPLDRLKEVYLAALSYPGVVGIVVGTRPDCVDEEKLDFFADLSSGRIVEDWAYGKPFDKPVVVLEYGIESCRDETLRRVNRCHDFACAQRAVAMTAERGIETGAHFILGLPSETRETILEDVAKINALPLTSVKFHQLQLVKGTRMEEEHRLHPEDFMEMELPEYIDFAVDILERLRPDMCVERIAGEVPPRFVSEHRWGLVRNFEILHMLDARLEARGTWQGRLC